MNIVKTYAKNIFAKALEHKDSFAIAAGNLNAHKHD